MADLADHVDFSASLGGEQPQVVALTATFVGGDRLEGWRFKIHSSHALPAASSAGMILADLEEEGLEEPEQSPTIRWTERLEASDAGAPDASDASTPQP